VKLKTLLTALSFIFVFSQPVFGGVPSEDTGSIAKNILKFKEIGRCNKCDLSGADFFGDELNGVRLYGANLTGANFSGADLGYAELGKANLKNVDLTGADLTNANLKGVNLTGADLKRAKIEGTIFCNTKTPWGLDNSGCKKE